MTPQCAHCRVVIDAGDMDDPNQHAVNCKLFRKQKQTEYFMTTSDKLDKVFAPKSTLLEDDVLQRIAQRMRALSPQRKAQVIQQLDYILRTFNG